MNTQYRKNLKAVMEKSKEYTDNIYTLATNNTAGTDTSTNILAKTSNQGVWVGSDTGHWYYWNGTQYVSGGVYQAIQLPSNGAIVKRAYDENVYNVLFNINNENNPITISANQGYYVHGGNGNLNSNSASYYTDLIEIDRNSIYHIKGNYFAYTCAVATYDVNGNFLRSYYYTGSASTPAKNYNDYYVPEYDEYYVRFSSYNTSLIIEQYNQSSNFNIDTGIIDYSYNDVIKTGKYINIKGILNDNTRSAYTEPLPINKGDVFTITLNYWAYTCGIVTYDKNKKVLRYYLTNNDKGTLPFHF